MGEFFLRFLAGPSHVDGFMGIRELTGLTIVANRKMSLEEWQMDVTHPLQNLLNLASARPNILKQLTLIYASEDGDSREVMPVTVIQQLILPGSRDGRVRAEGEMPFKLVDLPFSLELFLDRWLGLSARFRTVLNLSLATLNTGS